ncbi:GntR family transcriptional regulator [Nisaea sp.]|uniref:GntR family transcriptional regulator n=1 Tax=Nisaea sp. TaxID=2024842 RepID=UPI00329852EF
MQTLAAKPDLTALAHEAIRDAIMALDLAPGAPLAQEDLAARLGVSRQPVSHALAILRREGLVVDRGRKGYMVAPIDADRLLGLYQVRGAIDRLAASLAAERIGSAERPGERLTSILQGGREAGANGDIEAFLEADLDFHRAIHDLSGNAEIDMIVGNFWPHMVRSMRVVLEDRAQWPDTLDDHDAIADAVLSGDPERAGRLAFEHTDRTGAMTYRRLKQE